MVKLNNKNGEMYMEMIIKMLIYIIIGGLIFTFFMNLVTGSLGDKLSSTFVNYNNATASLPNPLV